MHFWPPKPQESAPKTALRYTAVFVLAATISAIIQAFPSFRDPDTFYHAKIAMLMSERGIVLDFSWLPFTTLADNFADHHLLYHLLLVPFIKILGPLVGMITATAVFSATALTAFYALLRTYSIRWPEAYVYILGTAAAFSFRLNLGKAGALSLTAIFLALIALQKGKPLALFVISFLYVWLHGGWPVMLIVIGTALLAKAVTDRVIGRHPWVSWAHSWFWLRLLRGSKHARGLFAASPEVRSGLATVAGLLCGLIINPYFPSNLKFYWEQIVQIAVVGYRDSIGVGSEWYPYPFADLVTDFGGAFVLSMIALTLLAFVLFWPDTIRKGKGFVSGDEIASLVMSWSLMFIFLVLTLRSKRHVEYLTPFLVLAAALLINAVITRLDFGNARRTLASFLPNKRWAITALVTWFAAILLYVGIKDVVVVRNLYAEGEPFGKYSAAASWIASRAPKDAVIMHSNWDDFPMLFFNDADHRYIAGLDATFLYRQNPIKYYIWRDITTGKVQENVARLTLETFGARYVFIENDHQGMMSAFEGDPAAVRAYTDAEASVFIIL